ncbi:TetR/AcrR family transcriptional regulator [Leucobacter weissii]|uniref:TetR/AcrR family transcriptional regulator n=1 Tax=Leucobacter weissii TaxID=1983706 RepID=A0A939S5J7_9MICO|nr:TetR/AcrR family transcriptional regulator [Leucobacter weissii]MBO1901404.1 TetR/AcrR family transcriptional regulator [Leucobacter weissii]
MAWDTERTRRRLLDAATAEFSEHGLAGARVDRIAARAGVNKERIYQYFGGKEQLFDAVVQDGLFEVAADVPLVGEGPEAVGGYAAALLDRIVDRPELARLMAWEGLARGAEVTGRIERHAHCLDKIAALRRALPGITAAAAGQLLLTIITLTNGWAVFPQLAEMFTGGDPDARRETVRRLAVGAAADALAAA